MLKRITGNFSSFHHQQNGHIWSTCPGQQINGDIIKGLALCHLVKGSWAKWSSTNYNATERSLKGRNKSFCFKLQTGNLICRTTYILACKCWSWGDPEINSRLQSRRKFKAALHFINTERQESNASKREYSDLIVHEKILLQ